MFAPIAVDNIQFPQSSSLSTLDFIPESFDAFQAYSNIPTSSVYSTGSAANASINTIMRWGMGSNDRILGIGEGGGTVYMYDPHSRVITTHGTQSPGTVRNVVWDNVTNSWVICGANSFVKISCADQTISASISVPTNVGTEYPAVVAFGGKAYAMPLVSTTTNTRVAIFDLVANTSTVSSGVVGSGTGGFWGACLTSIGTIYFLREAGGNPALFEYNPQIDFGTAFGNITGNVGYGITNLPNGNIFIPSLGTNQTSYIINPVNKSIQTIATAGFGYGGGICVGQNGHVYGVQSQSGTGDNGIWGFNTTTNRGYLTQYVVRRPSSGNRGFQDMFSLSDGRLLLAAGQNNTGLFVDYTYLSNPNSNTFSQVGPLNPIMTNGKGF